MLWAGQGAKDSAWQPPRNRKAAENPQVCAGFSPVRFQGILLSVLPIRLGKTTLLYSPDDETKVNEDPGLDQGHRVNRDHWRNFKPPF